jgi:hypothetical protein
MKLSLVLEVIEKGGNHIRKMTGDLDTLGRKAGPVAQAMEGVTKAGSRVEASTFRWMRATLRGADAFDRSTAAAARFAGRTGMKALELSAAGAARGIGLTISKVVDLTKSMVSWGALAVGGGIGWLIGDTIKTASTFEQLQIQLEGTEGSAQKAKDALAWVAKFAKDTPYDLTQVADAFARAKQQGIDPMHGAMTALGDAAGASRKELKDAVDAVADAQRGEYERLKDFGITGSTKGAKATFSYLTRAGKSTSKSVKNDMAEIRDAVLEIFNEKYGGGMARQAKSFAGIWSNITGSFTEFELKIANAGFFDALKGKLEKVYAWINKLEADGTLAKWAQNTSDWLEKALDKGQEFIEKDWSSVGKGLGAIVSAFVTLVGWIGKAVDAYSKWDTVVERNHNRDIATTWVPWVSQGERSQARKRWGELDDQLTGRKPVPDSTWQGALRARPTGAKALSDAWSKGLRSGPPALRTPAGTGKPDGKLRVEVDFKNAPAGMRATTTTSAPGVSATTRTAYRGRANGGPA